MRFHVLGIPHTVSVPEYSTCAFTQKVLKLCTMLKMEGHEVIHYGHNQSVVDCDESVPITTNADLRKDYHAHDWRKSGFPNFGLGDHCYEKFNLTVPNAVRARRKPGDFLLCSFGAGHKAVADALPDMLTVEPGIGYPEGTFARFKVYESYAIMHAYQGNGAARTPSNDFWYDAVIPNGFRDREFEFSEKKGDYFLFLGRQNSGKGIHIAKDIARRTGTKLILAGPGQHDDHDALFTNVGNVDPAGRKELLKSAKATICASTFLEPFCGVQIESFLSGTPVISTDRGAFAEYNIHGVTGYRCSTMEQFLWAARNIETISPVKCCEWGQKFTLEKIAPRYTEYFQSVQNISNGSGGWYAVNDERTSLANTSNGPAIAT